MPIPLPASSEEPRLLDALSPREIVAELDRHVIGQGAAKRAVAIALRNRVRRQKLPTEQAADITPKNILMIGPTGVGKTEIARRLARLSGSPFVKVEASKFTEVGYVGRDVDSIVRDLVEAAIDMVRRERTIEVRKKADENVEERLLDLLLPPSPPRPEPVEPAGEPSAPPPPRTHTRDKLRDQLRAGLLESRVVEVEVAEKGVAGFQVLTNQGVEEMDLNLRDMLPGLFGGRSKRRAVPVSEAREILRQDEEARLVDRDLVARIALDRVQSSGIVFLDELDKIAGREAGRGPDVSREGVQRDLLPIVEGTTVATKHGPVRTDHILFIAAGAFHVSKPADLIPELQGRFPIRVELSSLSEDDFVRILTEPRSALVGQYQALLATEGVELRFTSEAVRELARMAAEVNQSAENIGARRLATVLETVLEDLSFDAGHSRRGPVVIEAEEVRRKLLPLVRDQDLSRFIL
jgi:ATP-dependent HslUV protease ATP-binding subunit HslU